VPKFIIKESDYYNYTSLPPYEAMNIPQGMTTRRQGHTQTVCNCFDLSRILLYSLL